MSICNDMIMDENARLYHFGCNLKAERNRLRLSQEELAEKTSLTAKHIGKIERGLVNLKLTSIIELMEALDVPFEKLYFDKEL